MLPQHKQTQKNFKEQKIALGKLGLWKTLTMKIQASFLQKLQMHVLLKVCCCVTSVVSDSVRPRRWQPTRLPRPWDSPGKNTGGGCHFLLQFKCLGLG